MWTKGALTDKLATAEDDEETNPDGPSKVDETPKELDQVITTVDSLLLFQIFDSETGSA